VSGEFAASAQYPTTSRSTYVGTRVAYCCCLAGCFPLAWLPRGHVRARRAPMMTHGRAPTLIRTRGANAALAVRGGRACRHRTASCTAGNTGRCWASQTLLATHPRKESNTCAGFLNLKCTLKMQPEQSEASAACSKDHVSKSRAAGKKKNQSQMGR